MNINFSEKCIWDMLKETHLPIILYGMGNGADKVINEFNNRNIKVYGVMASDDFARYQNFQGFIVKKLSDFENELDDFIICLCFGSDIPNVIDYIYKISEKHRLVVPNVSLFGNEIVDDDFIKENIDKINLAYSLLSDSLSKFIFKKSIEFLYTGNISILKEIEHEKSEYIDLLELSDKENFLDLGAYTGDTINEFLTCVKSYSSITALEPNPKNFKKLETNTENLKNINLINKGISNNSSSMFVSKGAGRMASLSSTGDIEIETVSVDSLFENTKFTYIKADVEGMEEQMIEGATQTLKSKPKLLISAYHKPSDMWNLIIKIHEINSEYKFYLGKHRYIPLWDLNIYAK